MLAVNMDPPASTPVGAAAPPTPQAASPAHQAPSQTQTTDVPSPVFGVARAAEQRLVIAQMILHNFKSYAGTHTIGPFHKSFTAVVGPNGSGKSNVIDALLFVFGYRAAKMRQAKLGHLIHRSEAYPDLGECTVEVHFHEVPHPAPADDTRVLAGSKIVVSRTAYRNHQSRYQINGRNASYADVTALLRGKGVDLDHQRFLILQGEVENIAQMKPKAANENDEGLLEYLEDIIGTAQFKVPIETAVAELEALTEQRHEKLARVRLIEQEMDRLRPARDAAAHYVAQERTLHRTQARLARGQISSYSSMRDLARETRKNAAERIQELDREYDTEALQKESERLEREVQEAVELLSQTKAEVQKREAEMAKLNNEDVKVRELKKGTKRKLEKLTKQAEKLIMQADDQKRWAANYTEDARRAEQDLADVQKQAEEVQTKLEAMQADVRFKTRDLQRELDAVNADLRPWKQQIHEREAALELFTSEKATFQEASERNAKMREELTTQISQMGEQEAALKKATKEREASKKANQEALDSLKGEMELVTTRHTQARHEMHAARARVEDARAALRSTRSRGDVLGALRAERAKRWPGLRDRLGNLGTIEAKYDVAVSTAVGALDWIVVDTVTTAQKCLDYLRTQQLGRAKLICLDKLPRYTLGPISTPENVPRLFDLIKVRNNDPEVLRAFYHSMNDTLVAPDLDTANRIAFAGRRWRVVTLQGQLIDKSGTMSGGGYGVSRGRMKLNNGSSSSAAGLDGDDVSEEDIARWEKERDQAMAQVNVLAKELEELQKTIDEKGRALAHLDKDAMHAKLEDEQLQRQRDQAKAALAALPESGSDKETKKQLKAMDAEIAKKQEEVDALRARTQGLKAEVAEMQARIDDMGGIEYKVLRTRSADYSKRVQELSRAAAKAQLSRKQAEKQAAAAAEAAAEMQKQIEDLQTELEKHSARMEELTKLALEVQCKVEAVKVLVVEAEETLISARARLSEQDTKAAQYAKERAELATTVEDLDARISSAEAHIKQWNGRLNDVRAAIFAAAGTNQSVGSANQSNDEPDLDEGDADDGNEEFNPEALERDIKQLQVELSGMEVNLGVLAEFRAREAEHAERSADLSSVDATRDSHKRTTDQLKKTRLTRFMSGFGEISSRLKDMYSLLTSGGNAELELVDSMDPFAEGIIFSVMPPKKSWKQIANLSGGERTLASLALVFALHAFRPTPLYVLDEIDAALDFRNVSIIANYVREQSMGPHAAQFVIISLRHNMFELADRLVGIYKTFNCTKSIAINPHALAAAVQPQAPAKEAQKDPNVDKDGDVRMEPEAIPLR